MEYDIDALNCPNCGAPLNVKPGEEITYCPYCDSSVCISKHEETGEESATHTVISPELIKELKQLIISGKKADAIEVYKSKANVSKEEAEKFINSLINSVTDNIILTRPLSAKGAFFCVISFIVIILLAYVLIAGPELESIFIVICWILLIFNLINLLALSRSIRATIKYAGRKWTKATILKYAFISKNRNLSFFKLLLNVKKPDGTTFRAETNVMIKNVSVEKLQEGKEIDVKYIEGKENCLLASTSSL